VAGCFDAHLSGVAMDTTNSSASGNEPIRPGSVHPVGYRRRKTVQILECTVILCWVLTASSGCFGFYLGFDTKAGADKGDLFSCKSQHARNVNSTKCDLTAPFVDCTSCGDKMHDTVCDACHKASFDPVLIVISFWEVLLGLVGLLVHCGSTLILDRFGFLRNRFGRGFFLFFIGTLAVAQGLNFTFTTYLPLVVGCIDTVVGICVMFSYVCVKSGDVYNQTPHMAPAYVGPGIGDRPSQPMITNVVTSA